MRKLPVVRTGNVALDRFLDGVRHYVESNETSSNRVLRLSDLSSIRGTSSATQDAEMLAQAILSSKAFRSFSEPINAQMKLQDAVQRSKNIVSDMASKVIADAASQAVLLDEEAQTRATQIAQEIQDRIDAVAQEANNRANAILAEANTRALETAQNAQSIIELALAQNDLRLHTDATIALARSEITTDWQEGVSAEALKRELLAAQVAGNTAAIASEQTARVTEDQAIVEDVTVLFAQVEDVQGSIIDEAQLRIDGDAAEAASRNALSTQIRGDYEGTDVNNLSSGLLYNEKLARVTNDNALAQQITLLSAGAGEQFDWSEIWYFDSSIEGWTGISAPTVSAGWLKPVGGPSVTSPTGLAIDGAKYTQVRLRVRKTGTLTWSGAISWNGGSTVVDEPTYDANGIGLVTINPGWTGTIDYISFEGYTTQGVSDYYEIDWVAIGRPSPGASSAQLYEEQLVRAQEDSALSSRIDILDAHAADSDATIFAETVARATADAATAGQLQTLTATTGANIASISNEVTARTTADSAQAGQISTLSSTVGTNTAAIQTEQTTRATQDTSLSGQITTVAASSANALAAVQVEQNARTTADSAQAGQITALIATTGDIQASVITVEDAVTDLESAQASTTTTVLTTSKRLSETDKSLAEASLRNSLGIERTVDSIEGTVALAENRLTTKIDDGLLAEANARLALGAQVDNVNAAILEESTARATQDTALASQATTLAVSIASSAASILEESEARATADEATAGVVTTIAAEVANNAASIREESNVRVTADDAVASQSLALVASVGENTAAIREESNARATADEATASQFQGISATVGDSLSLIGTESSVRSTADTAQALRTDALSAAVGESLASIVTEQLARVTSDNSVVAQITTMIAQTATAIASIIQETNLRTSADAAVVNSVTTQIASLDTDIAAVEVTANTAVTKADGALAEYMVKLNANGHIAGYGLSAYSDPDGDTESAFIVEADKFAVVSTNGAVSRVPFTVDTVNNKVGFNSDVAINGNLVVNGTITNDGLAGNITYDKIASIDADAITTGTLDAARIGAGSIDSDKIGTNTLNAVNINTAGQIRSTSRFQPTSYATSYYASIVGQNSSTAAGSEETGIVGTSVGGMGVLGFSASTGGFGVLGEGGAGGVQGKAASGGIGVLAVNTAAAGVALKMTGYMAWGAYTWPAPNGDGRYLKNDGTWDTPSASIPYPTSGSANANTITLTGATNGVATQSARSDHTHNLPFTPVQQGGGAGQSTNKLYIGWSGSNLLLQVDSSNFGSSWPISVSGNANYANTAGSASSATSASSASSATNSSQLGGYNASDYLRYSSYAGGAPSGTAYTLYVVAGGLTFRIPAYYP